MTPEHKARLDAMGRTRVLDAIKNRYEQALPEDFVQACYEWISGDDHKVDQRVSDSARDARWAMYAAVAAAIAAIIAAIAAIHAW